MDLESTILSDVSQTKEKYNMTSLICEIYKEMIQMNSVIKQKETHRLIRQTYVAGGGRDSLGVWDGHTHTTRF